MTPSEKAVETRRKHKEAQEKKRQEERRIKESMTKALQEVLESDQATVDQKLEASKILSELIA